MSPHRAIARAFTRQSFVRSGRSRARSSSVPRASRVSRAPSARLPYPRNLQSFVHARLARSPESPRAFLARAHRSTRHDASRAFHDDDDARGLGLSELAYRFIAGILDHAQGLTAIVCPTVNSFKRIGVGPPDSGATWAPAYVAYGGNNRTQMIRVPEGGRIEVRAPDGSANPYLAFTAL